MRHLTTAVLCALSLTGCGDSKAAVVVASGRGGLEITADEFLARLEEQPPFVRAGYSTLEKKKELLESVVRFELLAQEAERRGLDRDPEAVRAMRKVMVQKLVQARMQAPAPPVAEAELTRYYDAHRAQYGERPLEQVRAQLENKLQREKRSEVFEAWVTSLKDGAAVTVDERALEALPLTP